MELGDDSVAIFNEIRYGLMNVVLTLYVLVFLVGGK
jgi:hypothetical protein